MIVARVWLRLIATLLLCLLGTAPASSRRCEPTGPVFEDRTPQRITARSVRRDGAHVAARVQTLDGDDDTPPLVAGLEISPSCAVDVDQTFAAANVAPRDAPRGRALPRGPPSLRHRA